MLQDAVNEKVGKIRSLNNSRNYLESELLNLAEQGIHGRKQQPDLVKQLEAAVGKVHRGEGQ